MDDLLVLHAAPQGGSGPPWRVRGILLPVTPLAISRLSARTSGAASGAPANSMVVGAPTVPSLLLPVRIGHGPGFDLEDQRR